MFAMTSRDRCQNPFRLASHSRGAKDLRKLSPNIKKNYGSLPGDAYYCTSCRKRLGKKEALPRGRKPVTFAGTSTSSTQPPLPDNSISVEEDRRPFDNEKNVPDKASEASTSTSTFQNFEDSLSDGSSVYTISSDDDRDRKFPSPRRKKCPGDRRVSRTPTDLGEEASAEALRNLKDAYRNAKSSEEKIRILTFAPRETCGVRQVAKFFMCSTRRVRKARGLPPGTTPPARKGNGMDSETKDLVINFYLDDENSRVMPGKKDVKTVRGDDGIKRQERKRLILCNLQELYSRFKSKYNDVEIGFSKFAQLRPAYCVLAGSSGTHTVCVCIYHENTRLMFEGAKISKLSKQHNASLASLEECLQLITCKEPTENCFYLKCSSCSGVDVLATELNKLFSNGDVDEISYDQWVSTDRCTLVHQSSDSDEFIETFCDKLLTLKTHDFVSKTQSKFFREAKENLQPGTIMIQMDFAENYSVVVQDEAQSYHWTNDQVSIFTALAYYKENGKLCHQSYAIVSNCCKHDSAAVYLCQDLLFKDLSTKIDISEVLYVTDGAAQHFKNKYQFKNLMFHLEDRGVYAEWHFHATAHGKGPCDGIGGNLKTKATRASLQGTRIMNAVQFYEFCKSQKSEISTLYYSEEMHTVVYNNLKERFAKAKTVAGTQKFHCFIPDYVEKCLKAKRFSKSADVTTIKM